MPVKSSCNERQSDDKTETDPRLACPPAPAGVRAQVIPTTRRPGSSGLQERGALTPDTRPRLSLNGFLLSTPEKRWGEGLQPPLPAKVNREGHSRLPSGLLGRLNSLTELSDSLKNMLRGPDFMTKFIYSGSEKTPNRVVFYPGPAQGMKS